MDKTIFLMAALVTGWLLDLLFGDPEGWPHPVRLFGFLIGKGEKWLNRGSFLFVKGTILALILCAGVFVSCHLLLDGLWATHKILYLLVSGTGVFYGLANRSLITEGKTVFAVLQKQGLDAGRRQLSRIVGRDTAHLSSHQIRIAVMETLSENLNDGVVAPLFYFGLAGVPGMLTYKMINTLDSMIGYRNSRYELFGKFAARMDDGANFLPARLTALLMVTVTLSRRGLRFIGRYARCHKSPNAGYPEAALAGILDLRFGGPNLYQGVSVEKPFIGHNDREVEPGEINRVCRINQLVCFCMVLLTLVAVTWPSFIKMTAHYG